MIYRDPAPVVARNRRWFHPGYDDEKRSGELLPLGKHCVSSCQYRFALNKEIFWRSGVNATPRFFVVGRPVQCGAVLCCSVSRPNQPSPCVASCAAPCCSLLLTITDPALLPVSVFLSWPDRRFRQKYDRAGRECSTLRSIGLECLPGLGKTICFLPDHAAHR